MKAKATRLARTVRIMRQLSVVSCPLSLVIGQCYWDEGQGSEALRTKDRRSRTSDKGQVTKDKGQATSTAPSCPRANLRARPAVPRWRSVFPPRGRWFVFSGPERI